MSTSRKHRTEFFQEVTFSYNDETTKLIRIMSIYPLAEKALGSPDHALEWLKLENPALGGRIPLNLLNTDPGAKEVENLLLRIEYGIYS